MPMEGVPTSLVKIGHLLFLSTAWGMQVWVTLAGFLLIRGVSRHTFGLVQSILFPFYFYAVLSCSFLNLALYAMYHPRELLSTGETLQISLFFLCMVLAAVNARWFSPTTSRTMLRMQEIEKEHGLGMEVGLQARREEYQRLREKDAKYRAVRQKFYRYHGLSSLCNLVCVLATGFNLCCAALHLRAL
ncbi:transmembrane protein 205 [Rhinatrema bivittatum]|uniref:transmembrane protein 205 n=1 Tax=Rhinatrema bivittatum TaxID=194408 RepID=UPI00112C51F7|nr:transmembrane protein 205 [Rhinatrema bivittatum]